MSDLGSQPAFPAHHTDSGLTKREYAAIMAMQGFLTYRIGYTSEQVAFFCVQHADALLKKLEEKQ